MKIVKISDLIKKKVPETQLGYIQADVKYEKNSPELKKEIQKIIEIKQNIPLEKIKEIPQIAYSRKAYKIFGKDPARYRLSAESLYRRIVKGKGLYFIDNVVDTINLASIYTGFSIGGYDYHKIQGEKIVFDIGRKDEEYFGIGRGKLNIENLPVFRDALGAFGSPTSDSERTKIDENTSKILLLVVNFGTDRDFEKDLKQIQTFIREFCSGKNFELLIFG